MPDFYDLADDDARRDVTEWCVDDTWFNSANNDCRLMHCLPVRRGVEVMDEVLDSQRSVVIQQAKNRMLTQTALLHHIMVQ
ncbi:MAG: hypothetical protein P8J17_03390 [Halioglobus sp.]|nr:hypothetical protein [Halioglobus sp.]